MSIFETLGELIGKAFRTLFENIAGLLKFKPEILSDVDRELALASLDPDKYENPDVKKLVGDIKEIVAHSPEGLSEWIETIFEKVFGTIHEVMVKVMIPFDAPDFEAAKANAGYLSSAFMGFILLASTLDGVTTAMSGTLVRNVFRYVAFMLQFFGFQKYMDIALMPAVAASILPILTRGYNKQYRTFIPPAPDLINWTAKEVFEPEMIDRYGLYDEKGAVKRDLLYEQGLTDDMIDNYWAAHWEHASYMQVIEMLHRGTLSLDKTTPAPPTTKEGWAARDAEGEKALFDWYRLVEIPPFWRDRLSAMSWNVPTRVDVRRWWDMRTISEDELRNVYHRQGYHGADLENYVKWTKVYTDFPMMMTRFTNGWITEQDIRDWLKGLEIPGDRIEQFIQEKTKPQKDARVAGDKNLTMALIVEGIKKGVLTESEGIELLMDLGYDESEADYIIRVRVETVTGSPETVEDFRDLTQKWRKAVGKEAKEVTEELKKAAAEVVRLTKEVESLREAVETEQKGLIEQEVLPEAATAKRDELRLALHRAEAELARVKTDYNALLAEWKHGA